MQQKIQQVRLAWFFARSARVDKFIADNSPAFCSGNTKNYKNKLMVSLLQVENISKSYGETVLFENLSLGINKGQKIALIAKNGRGKTSLLNIIAGTDTADSGNISMRNDLTIGYLEQEPYVDDNLTVIDQVLLSSDEIIKTIDEYHQAIKSNDKKRIELATAGMDAKQAWDYEVKIKQVLSKLNINDHNKPMRYMSGGQRKRIALANLMISEPDLLILDEPTNHLDLDMIEWLEDFLLKSASTLLMVTHDRYFLDRVCNEIVELDDKMLYKYRGNYSYFLEKRAERIQIRNSYIEKTNELLKKELAWMHRSPSARGTKSKSRIDGYFKLKDDVDGLKVEEQEVKIDIQTTRLGKKIINLYNLEKSFDDLVILDDFTYRFKKGDKIGIVGKNGSGKTTLLNIITGEEKTNKGRIEIGETVKIGYYKQEGIQLPEDKRVIEVIKDIAEIIMLKNRKGGNRKITAAQFLEHFLFPPEMHYNLVEKLSGGERRRLYMMTILMNNPNFLILDEPTNDLDIVTLNVLEEYLREFDGCLLIVSHDRYFMDKVIDTLFVFEGNGKVSHFPGNYSIYNQSQKKKEQAEKQRQKQEREQNPKQQKQRTTKRFTYNDKREYELIEKEIEELEDKKKQLSEIVNSGTLEANELYDKSNELNSVIELLDEKEMRWLQLNEQIEG